MIAEHAQLIVAHDGLAALRPEIDADDQPRHLLASLSRVLPRTRASRGVLPRSGGVSLRSTHGSVTGKMLTSIVKFFGHAAVGSRSTSEPATLLGAMLPD